MTDDRWDYQQQASEREEQMMKANSYERLAAIDVSEHIEKKNGLSYLSWAWAVDQLLRADPQATWSYGEPKLFGDTMMVFCTVTAFGKSMTSQLPVMDNRNRAVSAPDSFQVNTAMQRALVKAIALHGLGLYIYAGEDLPYGQEPPKPEKSPQVLAAIKVIDDEEMLRRAYKAMDEDQRAIYTDDFAAQKAVIRARQSPAAQH